MRGLIPPLFQVFRCNLPTRLNTNLEFYCREPSCGALDGKENAAELSEEDYMVDPNFFDEGYDLAGSTGFKVWTGSRLLIETLGWPQNSDNQRLEEIQKCMCNGARLIELGAGVGVVGTYLSAIGSQVLITDLSTLVENAIDRNLIHNKKITPSNSTATALSTESVPSWLAPDGMRVGDGWVKATPLDWTRPLDEQLTKEQCCSIEFIIASDVVFLTSMLVALLDTVESIFNASSNNPSFILSFQRRDAQEGEESLAFTTVRGVIAAIEERGWRVECLAWRPVTVRKETNGIITDDESEVYVFDIKP
mmetsp:Transcript_34317/g.83006  ORF Transcript_34317/g.83006 Transcript_34317/m.83006 type:complete len:307 (+) Transcript_34317:188-1108(+)